MDTNLPIPSALPPYIRVLTAIRMEESVKTANSACQNDQHMMQLTVIILIYGVDAAQGGLRHTEARI